MKYINLFVVLCVLLPQSALAQSKSLDERIEDCQIAGMAAAALEQIPEKALDPALAKVVLSGLVRSCGFLNGNLRRDYFTAEQRGDFSPERSREINRIISLGEQSGAVLQGIIRRSK